jgi:hypothetical protein
MMPGTLRLIENEPVETMAGFSTQVRFFALLALNIHAILFKLSGQWIGSFE